MAIRRAKEDNNYPARACTARGYVIGRGVYILLYI